MVIQAHLARHGVCKGDSGSTMTTTNPPPAAPNATCVQTLNELKAGRFLGRYELLLPLAQGGMAAVWAARLVGTRGFQKVVAIKTILPSLSEDARFEQMFLNEAGLAARVRHPNVVQVLDLGEEDGVLYQAMEWIDGEPLSVVLRAMRDRRGVPHAIAAKILIGVCDGLHAAHETRDDTGKLVGLVHRDVSPQNILVTRDGAPKVVDFGVAKASSLTSAQTAVGMLKGKPAYMAPEQIRGEDIDRRADIFSLGVLLYMLTTGRDPFRGTSDLATLKNVVSPAPADKPSAHQEGYPSDLEAVVMTALDKVREKRFPSAAAMARALEAAVPGVSKVGDAEVASFMRELLGDKLDKRRASLRKALNAADVRASQPDAAANLCGPTTLTGLGGPVPGASVLIMAPSNTAASLSLAPNVTTIAVEGSTTPLPLPVPTNKSRLAALGLAPLLLVTIGLLAVVVFRLSTTPQAAAQDTSFAAAAVTSEPSAERPAVVHEDPAPVPEPAQSASASKPPRRVIPRALPKVPVGSTPSTTKSAPTKSTGTRVQGTMPTIRDPGF